MLSLSWMSTFTQCCDASMPFPPGMPGVPFVYPRRTKGLPSRFRSTPFAYHLWGLQAPLLGCAVRWGEAGNPGPGSSPAASQSSILRIGAANVTRLKGREDEVKSLGPGVWALTETSSRANEIAARRAFFRKHKLWYHPSAPCQPRTKREIACGSVTYGGVAVVSSHPTRVSREPLSKSLAATTRLLVSFIHAGQCEIMLITVYLPPSSVSQDKRQQRLLLCDALMDQAVSAAFEWGGLAVIAGDFNHEMLRRHRRASPEGACLAFGKGDLDPFVWTVLRVLRQCRSFFATRDPEWQAFVEMTQVPFTAKTKVYGPAGVLKRYLQVMSLSVEVDGTIVFRNQARLHLLRCCYAELRNAVCEAWDDTVLARLQQRSGAEDLEPLDSSATRYVLDQMPDPSYRQAAVMHLAGGFPTRIHLTPECLV